MNSKNFFHILNPNKKNRVSVSKIFKKESPDQYIWVERKEHPTHLETIVDWAMQEGRTEIAVWGGDGTLSRVVQKLYELNALKKINVALVPVGTCNDFARKIKIKSWKYLKSATIKKIDLGVISVLNQKRIFVNNSGFGRSQKRMGKKSNPLEDIKNFTEKRLHLEWSTTGSKQFETFRVFLGIIFNAPYFNCKMFFDESISPEDGVLNGFLVPPQSKLKLTGKFIRTRLGGSLNDKNTIRIDGSEISLESDQDLYPQVDGEYVTSRGVRKLSFSVLPKALNLVVPA